MSFPTAALPASGSKGIISAFCKIVNYKKHPLTSTLEIKCKGTIKRAKYQINLSISEREYLRRSQS